MTFDVTYDVIIGTVVAPITIVAQWQWHIVRSLFDQESRRQAAQINGEWDALELFGMNGNSFLGMHGNCLLLCVMTLAAITVIF
jgi:hypothetical protein